MNVCVDTGSVWLLDFLSKCFSQTSLSPSASTESERRAFCRRGFSVSTAGQSTAAALCERRRQVCCRVAGGGAGGGGAGLVCCRIGGCRRVRAHGERGRLL